MLKSAVRRSACDQCRAKRVRCLRGENSTAPCARCSHIGARCVTGASGHPGRPPKLRLVGGDSTPRGPAASPAVVSSPGPGRLCTSTLRDAVHVEAHAMAEEPASVDAPARAPRCRANRRTSWDPRDGVAGTDPGRSKSALDPHSLGDPSAHGPQADFWRAPGDRSDFFGYPSIEQSPAPGDDMLALALMGQMSRPSQLQGLLGADDELNAMIHLGRDSGNAFDMDIDPLLAPWDGVLPPSLLPQCSSPASSLMRFREEMDQRIAAVEAYFSDPLKTVQGCKEEGAGQEAENPAALLLTCSQELIDIIQSLTPAGRVHMQSDDALSTEIVLLVLSSYLALMRFFDSLFHTIHKVACQLPPDSFKSVKVKSVLRIGGISSLQDMPLKMYATGILDAVQSRVRTLERCMGIPTEYCLSDEAAASPTAAAPGIFSHADRAQLFWAAMAQEDVQSRRGTKSYVESIRASIQGSMKFLDDQA